MFFLGENFKTPSDGIVYDEYSVEGYIPSYTIRQIHYIFCKKLSKWWCKGKIAYSKELILS